MTLPLITLLGIRATTLKITLEEKACYYINLDVKGGQLSKITIINDRFNLSNIEKHNIATGGYI